MKEVEEILAFQMHEFIGRYVFQNSSVPRLLATCVIKSARLITISSRKSPHTPRRMAQNSFRAKPIVKIEGLKTTFCGISRIFNNWHTAMHDLQPSKVYQTINGPAEACIR
jgi:hypothetical protein